MRLATSVWLAATLVLGCAGDGTTPDDDEPCASALAPGVELTIVTEAPEALAVTLEGDAVSCDVRSGWLACRAEPRGAREHVFRVVGPGVDREVVVEVTEKSAHPGFPDDRPRCQGTVLHGHAMVSIEVGAGDAGVVDGSAPPADAG